MLLRNMVGPKKDCAIAKLSGEGPWAVTMPSAKPVINALLCGKV
jgi:hypothetical protein